MSKLRSARWVIVLALLTTAAGPRRGVAFQASQAAAGGGSAPLTAEQDHQRLMDLLHITSLRPGAHGAEWLTTNPRPIRIPTCRTRWC